MKKRILVLSIAFILLVSAVWYVNDYYRSEKGIERYLTSSENVKVEHISEGVFFDGKGDEEALIFYPGGKVEYTAYAPLMKMFAEKGMDCFLIKMPGNLAILDIDKAKEIQENYLYDVWHIGGHSLGGAVASAYAIEADARIESLLLLGAYPMEDLSKTKMKILSIYGSEDQIMNRDKLEEGYDLVPHNSKYIEIPGGNHAWFGMYGEQDGDGKAVISKQEQWKITVDKYFELIDK